MSGVDVRSFAVGMIQENSYIVRASPDSKRAVIVDPGEEPERLLQATRELGVELEAILITHCHFDHIGAVAPLARATGARVYVPEIERGVLADVMSWVPPGFGPFESYEAEHTVKGGDRLRLAGLEIDVLFTPGHSPGHVTYAIWPAASEAGARGPDAAQTETADAQTIPGGPTGHSSRSGAPALLSGDVLFQGSVGRVDLPGGDWNVLERSIASLVEAFPGETVLYPGHMGITTLARELQTNPFLAEIRAGLAQRVEVEGASGTGEPSAASAPGRGGAGGP